MKDYIVRATAADEQIRAFAITSKHLLQKAHELHDTSPVVSAALGRTLSAAAMMGVMMKDEDDLLTLQLLGDGPVKGITVTADANGHVKGFANHPEVELPLNAVGKLDVGGAIGEGILRVMRDLGLREPYVGTTQLVSGEVAEDLTYYFSISEQTPSSVALGVLVDTDRNILQAGGFILQLMPFATDEVIDTLEKQIANLPSVTEQLSAGATPEDLLARVLGDLQMEITDRIDASFRCDCSRERVERSLISLPKSDLDEMIADAKPTEVRCHFCNKAYVFSPEDLKGLRDRAR